MTVPDENARNQAIESALEEIRAAGKENTRPVKWKKGYEEFPVIRMPLDMVVLNPGSHRIRAQVLSLPESEQKLLRDDPFSDEAQQLIARVIKELDGYAELADEMKEVGQREPGVVLRSGVLLNANRRVVALRENDPHGFVNLIVLPPKVDPKDLALLEWDLQNRNELKEDYTWTNALLQLEEMKERFNYTDEEAAKELGINRGNPDKALEYIRQRRRLLALIRDIQARSAGAVKLTDFDLQETALLELDRDYQEQRKTDAEGAEGMKQVRILGILTGVQYRHLRLFKSRDSVEDHVVGTLLDDEVVPGAIGDAVKAVLTPAESKGADDAAPEGLDDLGDADEGEPLPDLAGLVDLVARNFGSEKIELPTPNGPAEVTWTDLKSNIATALDTAHEEAKGHADASKSLDGPISRLQDATRKAQQALLAYRKVAKTKGFQRGKFEYQLKKLEQSAVAIREELNGKAKTN